MRLQAIAQWLQARGVGTVGQTIFINFIPDDIEGILLRPELGGTPKDLELPGYVNKTFWLIARAKTHGQADALCAAAQAALKLINNQTVDGVQFRWCKPAAYPFPYAPSPAQNVELAVKYTTVHIDSNV